LATPDTIRFEDGAGYERYMGAWSQLVGEAALDWLAMPGGLRWLDVGCGNGAFTEVVARRCDPASLDGVDPSAAQLDFARGRPTLRQARLQLGHAMALPFADAAFDVAVLPLVIAFVPDPAAGVAEVARVVRPGGTVAAYMWDSAGGAMPYGILQAEVRAMGKAVPEPPSPGAGHIDQLRALWAGAGLTNVAARAIRVERTFDDFEAYWTIAQDGPSVGAALAALGADERTQLRERLRARLPASADGRIVLSAVANAVRGSVA